MLKSGRRRRARRTVASYPILNGSWNSKTLFTLDHSQNWRMREVKDYNTGYIRRARRSRLRSPLFSAAVRGLHHSQPLRQERAPIAMGAFFSEQLRQQRQPRINFLSLPSRCRHLPTSTFGKQYSLSKVSSA